MFGAALPDTSTWQKVNILNKETVTSLVSNGGRLIPWCLHV